MSDLAHYCKATGCVWAADRRRLMCMTHWLRLPSALQGRVAEAIRAEPRASAGINNADHMRVCAEAVEHIASLEGRPLENSFRRLVGIIERAEQPCIVEGEPA